MTVDLLNLAHKALMIAWLSRSFLLLLCLSPAFIVFLRKERFIREEGESSIRDATNILAFGLIFGFIILLLLISIDTYNLRQYSMSYIGKSSCLVTHKGMVFLYGIKETGVSCSDQKVYVDGTMFNSSHILDGLEEGNEYVIHYLPKSKIMVSSTLKSSNTQAE